MFSRSAPIFLPPGPTVAFLGLSTGSAGLWSSGGTESQCGPQTPLMLNQEANRPRSIPSTGSTFASLPTGPTGWPIATNSFSQRKFLQPLKDWRMSTSSTSTATAIS